MYKIAPKIQTLLVILLLGFMQFSLAKKKDHTSLEEASEAVRKSTNGKVLSAKTTGDKGSQSHRIQVLTPSGRVKVYQVPASKKKDSRTNRNDKNRHQDHNTSVNSYRNSRNINNNNTRSSSNNRTRTSAHRKSKGESKQK